MPSSGVQTCADRKSTRLNSSHTIISYAVFCLKKKTTVQTPPSGTVGPPPTATEAPRERPPDRGVRGGSPGGAVAEAGSGVCVFFFNDTATTEIYTLSLHDALPI